MQITAQDVLLVIDVQNDFCPGGALAVSGGDQVIDPIHRAARRFEHVILTQDWHPAGHSSFAAAHPGNQPFEQVELSYGLILRKGYRPQIDSYSAFFENDRATPTGLAGYLHERGLTRVFLAGLAYDFCVGYSALDARRLGLSAVILRDACRAIDLNGSVAEIERQFSAAGVELADSAEL
jgi:nicotinamidase/pyrazinamidase